MALLYSLTAAIKNGGTNALVAPARDPSGRAGNAMGMGDVNSSISSSGGSPFSPWSLDVALAAPVKVSSGVAVAARGVSSGDGVKLALKLSAGRAVDGEVRTEVCMCVLVAVPRVCRSDEP